VPEAPPDLDERELRAAQAATAVLLLGAFVFRVPLLVVGLTVVLALGAALGSRANGFHIAFRTLVAPRLRPPLEFVGANSARALDATEAGLLAVASIAFALSIDAIGWVFALAAAAFATVEATTGYNGAEAILERLRRQG